MDSVAGNHNFREYCVEAAREFITTVVSIDDDPRNEDDVREAPRRKAGSLETTPQRGLSAKEEPVPKEDPAISTEEQAGQDTDGLNGDPYVLSGFSLRTEQLINALADENILCSVFVPRGESDDEIKRHIERGSKLAACADAVLLDWDLKRAGGSATAVKMISQILSDDFAVGGRLRLILIYTAENDLSVILNDVRQELTRNNSKIVDDRSFRIVDEKATVEFSNTRIAVLNKADTRQPENNDLIVPEEEIPQRIIREFAMLSYGLFPSIALHSMTAVRKSTHHLLSTLSKDFDPAIITHRCLLENPEDAEDFCLDIVAGEMRSAISLNRVGRKHASPTEIKKWLDAKSGNDDRFVDETTKFFLNKAEIEELTKQGQPEERELKKLIKNRWTKFHQPDGGKGHPRTGEQKFSELLLQIIAQTGVMKAREIDLQFARLAALKRERYGKRHLPPDWQPSLTLGTVIQRRSKIEKELFLCVQPRCDSVGISGEKSFPFLKLHRAHLKGSRIFAIVLRVRDASGSEKDCVLYADASPYQLHMMCFESNSQLRVTADKYSFKATNTKRFDWIADIKDKQMLEISGALSDRQGAIGTDTYEWLRRRRKN